MPQTSIFSFIPKTDPSLKYACTSACIRGEPVAKNLVCTAVEIWPFDTAHICPWRVKSAFITYSVQPPLNLSVWLIEAHRLRLSVEKMLLLNTLYKNKLNSFNESFSKYLHFRSLAFWEVPSKMERNVLRECTVFRNCTPGLLIPSSAVSGIQS